MIGTTIAHYRIIEKLGEGGMGVVYKAEDPRLGRFVALKFIPEDFAHDPAMLERFRREARAASALNHPNICTIYDIGEADGRTYLAMECLSGATLKHIIEHGTVQGTVEIDRLVEIAIELAQGLEAAHAENVIHRDLKPANIFITTRGTAKILDFGLAKIVLVKTTAGVGASQRRSQADSQMSLGGLLGTVAYMSPEQALGKPLDLRSDLFSLGVVIYEMATGLPPFRGDSTGDVLLSVVQKAPVAPVRLNPDLPEKLERIINKCLEKDRTLRYQHATDILIDLKRLKRDTTRSQQILIATGIATEAATEEDKEAQEAHEEAEARPPQPEPHAPTRYWRWPLALAAVAVTLAAVLTYFLTRPSPPPKLSNYVQLTHDGESKTIEATDRLRLYLRMGTGTSLRVAEISVSGGNPVTVPIPSQGLTLHDVSPDGSDLLATDKSGILWSLPTLGGSQRQLGRTTTLNDLQTLAAWSPDGKLLVYCDKSDLFLAAGDGTGTHKLITAPGIVYAPEFSLDQTRLRFTVDEPGGDRSLWEVSVQGSNLHRLLPPGPHNLTHAEYGKWTPDGKYFIFESRGQIWALPEKTSFLTSFFSRFGSTTGSRPGETPIRLTDSPLHLASPLPSLDGRKLFVSGQSFLGELVRYDRKSGEFLPFLSGISAEQVSFSKDGQWVAYVTYPEGILWRCRIDGTDRQPLTNPPLYAQLPRWSPDGKEILFSFDTQDKIQSDNADFTVGKPFTLYKVSRDGGSPQQVTPDEPGRQSDPNWSPDGTRIVYAGGISDPTAAIHIFDLRTHKISDLPDSRSYYGPRWSPDGRYIAAVPPDQTSIVLFDLQTRKWSELVRMPLSFSAWSADGKYIYFLHVPDNPAVLRVRISDRKVEQVADLKNLPLTGFWGISMALTPDDSPLLLRNLGAQDIYSLDFEAP